MIVSESPRIDQVGDGTVPEIVEHEVLNLLIQAKLLNHPVGMSHLPAIGTHFLLMDILESSRMVLLWLSK